MILAIIVCTLILVVGALDWITFRHSNRRALALELFGFSIVLVLALRPEWFNLLATKFGIGRGVDLLTYPMLIWLFREAIVGRVRYRKQREEITKVVRDLAIVSKTQLAD